MVYLFDRMIRLAPTLLGCGSGSAVQDNPAHLPVVMCSALASALQLRATAALAIQPLLAGTDDWTSGWPGIRAGRGARWAAYLALSAFCSSRRSQANSARTKHSALQV